MLIFYGCLLNLLRQTVSVTTYTHHIVQKSRVCLLSGGASCQPHADLATATDSVTIKMDPIPFHPKKTCSVAAWSAQYRLILIKLYMVLSLCAKLTCCSSFHPHQRRVGEFWHHAVFLKDKECFKHNLIWCKFCWLLDSPVWYGRRKWLQRISLENFMVSFCYFSDHLPLVRGHFVLNLAGEKKQELSAGNCEYLHKLQTAAQVLRAGQYLISNNQ